MPSSFAPPSIPVAPLAEADSPVDPRANFRIKTAGTRLTVAEVEEVEAAAKRAGKTLAEWLREVALRAARPSPADPVELLLQELAATRYMLLNLFHASAQMEQQGLQLLPEAVLKVRDAADARKGATARKLLADFLAGEGTSGSGSEAEQAAERGTQRGANR